MIVGLTAALLLASAPKERALPHMLENCAFSGRSIGNELPGLHRNSPGQGIGRIMKIVDPRKAGMLLGWAYFPMHGNYLYLQANDTMPRHFRDAAARYIVTENSGNGVSLNDLEDNRNAHYSTIVAVTRFPWPDLRLEPCTSGDWMNEVFYPQDGSY